MRAVSDSCVVGEVWIGRCVAEVIGVNPGAVVCVQTSKTGAATGHVSFALCGRQSEMVKLLRVSVSFGCVSVGEGDEV